jgi:hypothetical protein
MRSVYVLSELRVYKCDDCDSSKQKGAIVPASQQDT